MADIDMLTIADIAADIPYSTQIGPFGKALTPEDYTEFGTPLLRGINVNKGRFFDEGFVFVSEEIADSLSKYICNSGEIILVHKGTIGQIGIISEKTRFSRYLMGNSMLRVVVDKQKMLPEFLYYWMCSNDAQWYLQSRLSTVGVPQLHRPLDTLRKLPVPNLSIKQQQRILQPLKLLDSLVENNANLNKYLNEYMNSLFRSWFVDFDPVKAKAEGKLPYGMDEETAALFPDSFEDSELGSIPKGWAIVTISDVCDFVSRGVTPDYEDGTGRWIINQKVNNGVNLNLENLKELSKSCLVPEDKFAKRFDVLVNCLGEGTLGRIHFFTGDSDYYAVDQHMSICRAKSPSAGLYIYHTLSSPTGQWRIDSVKTGSTGMTMFNISKLRAFKIYIPPQRILDEFWANVSDLIHQNQICLETGNALIHTRDVLLPRMMSGELSVS